MSCTWGSDIGGDFNLPRRGVRIWVADLTCSHERVNFSLLCAGFVLKGTPLVPTAEKPLFELRGHTPGSLSSHKPRPVQPCWHSAGIARAPENTPGAFVVCVLQGKRWWGSGSGFLIPSNPPPKKQKQNRVWKHSHCITGHAIPTDPPAKSFSGHVCCSQFRVGGASTDMFVSTVVLCEAEEAGACPMLNR